MWNAKVKALLANLSIMHPIIQGPMGGGVSSPELVAAVSNAGGLGSMGAGYMTPEAIHAAIQKIHMLTQKPFAVNLFVPGPFELNESKINFSKAHLAKYCQDMEINPETLPVRGPEDFNAQLEAILESNVPIISFTFGIPDSVVIKKIKARGMFLLGTATTVEEGILVEQAGCDAVVAQGFESGGHRGTFAVPYTQGLVGTMALVPQMVDALKIPVIAAGGIMDARGLKAALALGASAVQMGTAFLVCHESGAQVVHKQAILAAHEDATILTKTFSGKPARGVRNRFINEMEGYEKDLPDYPVQHYLTQPIRQAATKKEDAELLNLWSGQGVRLAKAQSAAELIQTILAQIK